MYLPARLCIEVAKRATIMVAPLFPNVVFTLLYFYEIILVGQQFNFAQAFQPAFGVDSGATTVARRRDCLAIAVVRYITSREDARDVGHGMLNRDDITRFVHINQ